MNSAALKAALEKIPALGDAPLVVGAVFTHGLHHPLSYNVIEVFFEDCDGDNNANLTD